MDGITGTIELRTPQEWQVLYGDRIVREPLGWTQGADGLPPIDWNARITFKEYTLRALRSTLTAKPHDYASLASQ